MKTYYLTFGQDHTHRINGTTWDCDVVCAIKADSYEEMRRIAFENFGPKFATTYTEKPEMEFFPRGIKFLFD